MDSALQQNNMHLMKTLDDAWNSQDWDTFSKRNADDVVVRWPAQPPTRRIEAHRKEGEYFFSARRLRPLQDILRARRMDLLCSRVYRHT